MASRTSTLTITLVDGTQVVVPNRLDQITPYVLQEQGDWFEDEIRFLRRLVQPGQTVLDIGANVGVYALCLARRVGPGGQVWGFEPAEATAALLSESVAVNATPWLRVQRQALSDHSGSAWLQTPGHSELNSLASDPQGPGETVPLTTLDACREEFGWRQVDLLKIDAEGEEERILAGGRRFFAELSPLVMFEIKSDSELHLELVQRFQELGYGCHRLVPGLDLLMPFDPAAGVDGYLLNLFAAKPERAAALAAAGWLVPSAKPEPPGPKELEPYHWRRALSGRPYARALAAAWGEQSGSEAAAAAEPLALWAYAQDRARPLDRRLGALLRSHQVLREQTQRQPALTALASLSRVAHALGERSQAVRALGLLITELQGGPPLNLLQPFLPPLQRYDDLDPAGRLPDWLLSSCLEADEILGAYSGFYLGERGRARLQCLLELGYAAGTGAVAARRLELLNRRFPSLPPGSPQQARRNEAQLQLSKQAWQSLQGNDQCAAWPRLHQARALGIDCPASLHYIAKCLIALGTITEATALLQRAVELNPDDPALLVELGLALRRAAEPQAGEAVLHQAVFLYSFQLAGGEASAADLTNLAIAYDELGEREQALTCLEQALEREPAHAEARLRKAAIVSRQPDGHDAAEAIWQSLLEGDQRNAAARAHTIVLRITQGDLSEAERLLQLHLQADPGDASAHHQLAFVHSVSGPGAVAAHLEHLRRYWARVRADAAGDGSAGVALSLPPARGRLRLGVLSAEIGDHVVSLFLEPFLRHYNRERLEVELIEVHEHRTPWADQLRALADAVIPLGDVDRPEARRRLRSRGYHVLVETSGFTAHSGLELLAERCAPVQCHYIGFHASTGLDTIDWFIGDEVTAAAELADHYVEGLWRLPRLWLASRRPPELPEATSTLAATAAPVLGSFNQFGKVGPQTLDFWAAALRHSPGSVLHLKSASSDAAAPRRRILEGLERRGVDPARVRVLERTAGFAEHLGCYRGVDIALDATPWAGATTSFEALAMGVPVVGILGGTTAGRMTCSILHALGQDDWIARDPAQFAAIVGGLCSQVAQLRAGRSALQQRVLASSLFDGAELALELERAFFAMARRGP
ncbi:MAG: FkbM family methyltransferase [Cyanobacteria bacterium J06638_7]